MQPFSRDNSPIDHAIAIQMTEELRSHIIVLERAACNKRQIEALLLHSTQEGIQDARANDLATNQRDEHGRFNSAKTPLQREQNPACHSGLHKCAQTDCEQAPVTPDPETTFATLS